MVIQACMIISLTNTIDFGLNTILFMLNRVGQQFKCIHFNYKGIRQNNCKVILCKFIFDLE